MFASREPIVRGKHSSRKINNQDWDESTLKVLSAKVGFKLLVLRIAILDASKAKIGHGSVMHSPCCKAFELIKNLAVAVVAIALRLRKWNGKALEGTKRTCFHAKFLHMQASDTFLYL